MKLLALMILSISTFAQAHLIEGTQVLKGSVKTKIMLNAVKTTCKIEVEKVTNLLEEEDSFGNPAYLVRLDVSLRGDDSERRINNRYDLKLMVDNLFKEGSQSLVKDLAYKNLREQVSMNIDSEGRIKNVSFPFKNQTVHCKF